ncbi:MAG TPA: MFS transporter [Candidatus Acidoferrum sp.]|nr:MFS transporter [Candidatus Acidoferrum sp.]
MESPPARPRLRGIVMFGVLLASYAINAMDRQLFPLLVPEVRRRYGFSLAGVGFLSTVFTLGMALAGVPTGYLLVRFSRKTVMQAGIALFSAGTLLTIIARGFPDMLIYRAATGIGEAMQLTVLITIAVNYFVSNRSAALGAINFSFGLGAIVSPILGGALLGANRSWQAPMAAFGLLGFLAIAVIAVSVAPWFTEGETVTYERKDRGGAPTLVNRNTVLLTVMSLIGGLVLYGYLGMYPTFLREGLGYSPAAAGTVMSFYGLGAIGSIAGGWLGDRFSPRLVLSSTFFCAAALGYLLFHGSGAFIPQAILSFLWGLIVSGVIYVNLAGYHAKALRSSLAGRASGIFVTSLYGSAAVAGYLVGWIATRAGWTTAGEIQISLLSLIAGGLALALQPNQMS